MTLSIVVPAYQVSAYLPDCLGSLLRDASEQIEVVVINDASPDSCAAIAEDYAHRDARVRAVHLVENAGLGGARNLGLKLARGEYVWFVDGDDLVPDGAVAAVRDRLASVRPDLLLMGHQILADDQIVSTDLADVVGRGPLTLSQRPALLRTRQAAWNRVVRRDLLDRTGVRFPTGWYEDVVFSYLLLLAAEKISTLGEVAYLYRQRAGGITSTPSLRHFDVFDQYEWLFDTCVRWRAPQRLRAYLFIRMIEHYLVILGADQRVPREFRPEFFARIVRHYWRYLPGSDFPQPSGLDRIKHWLIRQNSYPLFAGAQTLHRVTRQVLAGAAPRSGWTSSR